MLTGSLATTGLIVLGIYIIGMLGIGVYCNKKYANNLSGFLTGGRNLGPWVFALTYGSTYLSASTFIGNTGTAYKAGMAYLMMPVAQVVLLPIGLILFSHGLRRVSVRLNAMTLPEYISKRFHSNAASMIASVVIIIFMVPYMVGVIKGGALSLASLLGMPSPRGACRSLCRRTSPSRTKRRFTFLPSCCPSGWAPSSSAA